MSYVIKFTRIKNYGGKEVWQNKNAVPVNTGRVALEDVFVKM
jgi:hypothetical protein